MFGLTDSESKNDKTNLQIESLDFLIDLLRHQIESYDKIGDAPAQLRGDLDFAENTVNELRKKQSVQKE